MLSFLSVLGFIQIGFGQHNLSGNLSYENEAIPYAQLLISPIQASTVADFEGKFEFTNLPKGSYTLKIIALGYKPIQMAISIPYKSPELSITMEKDVFGLEEVTVTANRNETSRRNSPIPINVMSSAKLEQLSANSIADGIKFSPGLRIENNCQNCGFSQVRINGLPGAYSQILIDGKATFSALNSIYGLEQIPTDMVKRIEIIKGGGSALYGSNAIAGNINLITKQPVSNSASVKTESSLIGTKSWEQVVAGNASIVSKDLKQGVTVFANYRNRNPYDHNTDGYTELPKLNNLGMGAKAFQKIYKTKREKYKAVIDEIEQLREKGRPVLVGTTSVEVSELLGRMLQQKKIPHNVLNAKQHAKEAQVIAEAGLGGNVTIATNMAGRGTDIKLGAGVKDAGGLAIIGTERHESRRVDRQLRGRAGRQGDPGSSQFYVSLEDKLMRLFGSERIAKLMDRMGLEEGEVIQHSMVSKSIERAQKKVEENNFGIRKRLLEYDDIMNAQREFIYKRRRNALDGKRLQIDIANMIYETCEIIVNQNKPTKDFQNFEFELIRFSSMTSPFSEEEFETFIDSKYRHY